MKNYTAKEIALSRKNTFSYNNVRSSNNKNKLEFVKQEPVSNPLLELRQYNNYVTPAPFSRHITTLDNIKEDEVRKHGIKVNISPEILASKISNKFLQIPKLDENGNKIKDPNTGDYLMETKSLMDLLSNIKTGNEAGRILLSEVRNKLNGGIDVNNLNVELNTLQVAMETMFNLLKEEIKKIDPDIKKSTETLELTSKIRQTLGDASFDPSIYDGIILPAEISFNDLIDEPDLLSKIYLEMESKIDEELFIKVLLIQKKNIPNKKIKTNKYINDIINLSSGNPSDSDILKTLNTGGDIIKIGTPKPKPILSEEDEKMNDSILNMFRDGIIDNTTWESNKTMINQFFGSKKTFLETLHKLGLSNTNKHNKTFKRVSVSKTQFKGNFTKDKLKITFNRIDDIEIEWVN